MEIEREVASNNMVDKANKTKGKRPAVQITEKQVMGSYVTGSSKMNGDNKEDKNGETLGHYQRNRHYNKAGAAEEHTVVRGEQNGTIIKVSLVSNQRAGEMVEEILEMNMGDHHNDPPRLEKNDIFINLLDVASDQEVAACMHTNAEGLHVYVDMGC